MNDEKITEWRQGSDNSRYNDKKNITGSEIKLDLPTEEYNDEKKVK